MTFAINTLVYAAGALVALLMLGTVTGTYLGW